MIKKSTIILVLILICQTGFSQATSIKVEVKNQALNSVLLELRDQYNFQLSYSDNELSKYKITLSKSFTSKKEALNYLIKNLPLKLKQSGEVFIIIPDKKKQKVIDQKKTTRISGQIVEVGTYEPLPFSHILINNRQLVSDVMGAFNYTASVDSSFHIKISHLGYYVYDTVLYSGLNQQFKLLPASEKIPEILVKNNIIERATLLSDKPGNIKLNHNISRYLPGQGDNSVFNLLRLMPGIQAAGEQATDLLIWGSYEGQSQIIFDEFTVFGLKNYNDNISVVNPFLVKNIEIFKGGFEAKYGNRVGGLVNITGKNGSLQKPTFSFNINQTTLNGMLELPLFKRSSLILAYRQTYYNLYNSDDFNIFAPTRSVQTNMQGNGENKNINFDISVYPDNYKFRDFNLKYTYNFENNDQFFISMYSGNDSFGLTAETEIERSTKGKYGRMNDTNFKINFLNSETNHQRGLSSFYNIGWDNGNSTKLILAHSDFSKQNTNQFESENLVNANLYNKDETGIENSAIENSLRIENIINFKKGHQLEFGAGVYSNFADISNISNYKDTLAINNIYEFENKRAFIFIQDILPITARLKLKSGVRINALTNQKRFIEPRLSASFKLSENMNFNASWGIYNQYMYKVANVDQDLNYTYLWVTINENSPVLNATHWVGGLNYVKNNFTVNVEGYFKSTRNITRRFFESRIIDRTMVDAYYPYFGDAKTYGIDTYIKKDFGRHSVWASYTLSKVIERLAPANISLPDYSLAPHDQRHEFKISGIFNIQNFYLSANYVYGSGMEIIREAFEDETSNISYNRVDAAVTYNFKTTKFKSEAGISVLNVFDSQNLKYDNLRKVNIASDIEAIRIYTDAVPFTPTLFFKIIF